MSFLEAVVLGVVQGLTEFLPISSTAHLRVVPALLHWQDPGVAYSAVIQLGSVIAVIAYFMRDLLKLAFGSLKAIGERNWSDHDLQVSASVVIGTLPICLLGLLFKSVLEQNDGPTRSLFVIGFAAIFMGLLLLVAEMKGKRERDMEALTIKDGLLVGLGQALALIPGCSRSGSTMTVAMLLNMKREDAAHYSFLLGIPAITLSGLLEFYELTKHGLSNDSMSTLVVGLVTSLVVSYLAIHWLLKYLRSHSTWVFVVYRFIFGVMTIGLGLVNLQGQ
jgi:undecaprenyl-diphosphatase